MASLETAPLSTEMETGGSVLLPQDESLAALWENSVAAQAELSGSAGIVRRAVALGRQLLDPLALLAALASGPGKEVLALSLHPLQVRGAGGSGSGVRFWTPAWLEGVGWLPQRLGPLSVTPPAPPFLQGLLPEDERMAMVERVLYTAVSQVYAVPLLPVMRQAPTPASLIDAVIPTAARSCLGCSPGSALLHGVAFSAGWGGPQRRGGQWLAAGPPDLRPRAGAPQGAGPAAGCGPGGRLRGDPHAGGAIGLVWVLGLVDRVGLVLGLGDRVGLGVGTGPCTLVGGPRGPPLSLLD